MPELLPNWHPIFVHFSIALLSIATLLFVTAALCSKCRETLQKTAHVNLWLGVVISFGTVAAGLYAANHVAHDGTTHPLMMNHRNWALATVTLFAALATWSALRYRKDKPVGLMFVALMVIATGILAITGYKGGELVYRYGTGVLALPKTESQAHSGHAHNHGSHSETAAPAHPTGHQH